MSEINCPNIGKANLQRVFAVLEDVSGVLQRPVASGFILPSGSGSMSQTPGYTNSEELSRSLNVLEQFQDAVEAGEVEIPMLLRLAPSYGAPQGDALLTALMGSVQAGGSVTMSAAAAATASATTITVDGVTGGVLPPRGVLTSGTEKILYTGWTESSGTYTLTGCQRGYAGTTAASIADNASISLASRVWLQEVCRPTVSVWMEFDHFVSFMSGCVVTQATFPMSNTGGQAVTVSLQGRKMGWAGTTHIASVSGAVVTLEDGGADAYTVGAIIKNKTKADDNSGTGYTVTAVNASANTITLNATPSDWAEDDVLAPWLPEAQAIGSPIESRDARVYVSGVMGRRREGELQIGTPTTFTSEIGDEYPGENADGKREISLTGGLYFRREDAQEFGRGYRGYELPVQLTLGDTAGKTFSASLPRMRFNTPTLSTDGEFLTLDQDGYAMGQPNVRDGESSLYLVLE